MAGGAGRSIIDGRNVIIACCLNSVLKPVGEIRLVYQTLKIIVLSTAFTFTLFGCQYSAMAEKNLEGITWTLNQLGNQKAALAEPSVTLQFDGDSVAGSAGCNQYRGTVTYFADSGLAIGPVARTKKLCPGPMMQQEDEFLRKLENVTGYELDTGRLLLIYDEGNGADTLVFGP
jgi:heat shock protein HslJ